jgi:hypothetical protein
LPPYFPSRPFTSPRVRVTLSYVASRPLTSVHVPLVRRVPNLARPPPLVPLPGPGGASRSSKGRIGFGRAGVGRLQGYATSAAAEPVATRDPSRGRHGDVTGRAMRTRGGAPRAPGPGRGSGLVQTNASLQGRVVRYGACAVDRRKGPTFQGKILRSCVFNIMFGTETRPCRGFRNVSKQWGARIKGKECQGYPSAFSFNYLILSNCCLFLFSEKIVWEVLKDRNDWTQNGWYVVV